ncbi:MAG: hypothetical protein MUE31_01845 [Candidatus Nanopelagicales bacterium]|nr:hypothetical protein [Candidatus Nanopelagicales bacterium]
MSTPMKLVTTMSAAAMLGAGLLAPGAQAATVSKAPPDSAMKVMTLNLYLGGSLGDAINAATKGIVAFLPAAANVYDTAVKTDFPLRAQWIAKTIKKQDPDVITLNEVTEWLASSSTGVDLPSEFLSILKNALMAEGLAFEVASVSDNADIGYSPTLGIPYYKPNTPGCDRIIPLDDAFRCQVRLKDRDVIMYNTASPDLVFTGTADNGNFAKQTTFTVADAKLSFDRGWASAGFTWRGKPVTVITSHLEVESQDGKGKKGKYGPRNWPSKVQVAQGKELLKISKSKAKETEGRVILAGDLNSDANGYYSPTYRNLTRKYFKDSWKQAGGKFGKAVGATCCQTGTLKSSKRLDSGDPVIPTRIDLVLTRKAKAVWKKIDGTKLMQKKQPKWQSDHYFYAAAVTLK